MPQLPETRHSLLLRLKDQHDSAAWSEFLELYEPWILGWARRRGMQEADAREFCQDLLVRLSSAVAQWRPDARPGGFRAFLLITAKRLAIDFFRRPKHRPQSPGGDELRPALDQLTVEPEWVGQIELDFRRRVFEWAAQRVRERCAANNWLAFQMTCLEGQAPDDVATRLGMSVGQVYVARSRILARLRHEVAQWEASQE
ncbi:MAG: sigma-70 family RNA polymerase sigma factor [Planctomycetales bacterium]|nr:sigma-70 family RNA polymerase sigma factor [Planctomycetales bacterium]